MWMFRAALVVVLTVVILTTATGRYAVATTFAALAVPILMVVYLVDVNIYEKAPLVPGVLTLVWGATAGAILGLAGRAAVDASELVAESTARAVAVQGVILPLAGFALALAGPLLLLLVGRFDEVLDGATFGATSAAWLAATQLLVQASGLLDSGVHPGGSFGTWAVRLFEAAVAYPLVWATAGGIAVGTFWLRYGARRPRRGRAGAAVLCGAVAVVVVSTAHVLFPLWAAAGIAGVVAVAGLVWLRELVHLGLTQEATAFPIGAPIRCADCGRETPEHTFCGHCGVALGALPKARRTGSRAAAPRLRNSFALAGFTALLIAGGAAAGVGAAVLAPGRPPRCDPGEPCGGPPSSVPRFSAGAVWRSALGVALEYQPATWQASSSDADGLTLRNNDALVDIRVVPAAGAPSPLDALPASVRVEDAIDLPVPHAPNVGYIRGSGAWYNGLLDTPQGPRDSVAVSTLSAQRRRVVVEATTVFFAPASELFGDKSAARDAVDSILNTVVWPDAHRRVQAGSAGKPGGLLPADGARAYDIDPLWRRGIRGRGETIAVVSLDGFRDEDIAAYDRATGVRGAGPVVRVSVLGPVTLGGGSPIEVALDLEVVRAVAPEATILDYEAPPTWEGYIAALKRINDDGRAAVVSTSWGKCTIRVPEVVRAGMERELARAARAGRTIFVAAGDSGAYSCLHTESELDPAMHALTTDWPAASPNVVAVGGTRLSTRLDGSYFSEDGWEDTLSNGATGGGSGPYPRPRWQRAPGLPHGTRRLVPDVAGPADCDSAFFIVYPVDSGGGWEQRSGPNGCGTSAAAPFWAGVAALVRQYARAEHRRPPGFLGPVLYSIAATRRDRSAFHDVQVGGDLKDSAGPGWDFAAGLGSPDAWRLAVAVARRGR
jgi:subtilisin family serine protease